MENICPDTGQNTTRYGELRSNTDENTNRYREMRAATSGYEEKYVRIRELLLFYTFHFIYLLIWLFIQICMHVCV